MLRLVLFILFILFLGGCTSPVIDLPDTPEKLIIQSEFRGGEEMDIYLFKGIGIPSSGSEPIVPESVDLRVFCEGIQLEGSMIAAEIPFYRIDANGYESGTEFTLKANLEGEETVASIRSKTIIPEKDSILNLDVSVISTEQAEQMRTIWLNFEFDISTHNRDKYYEFVVLQEAEGRLMPPVDTLWVPVNGDAAYVVSEYHVLAPGINWLKSRNSFLIDQFRLTDKHISLTLQMTSTSDSDLSRLRLMLKSHTQDGYEFIKSYDHLQSEYYAEFPILVSNIQNGIGIFTAYAQSEQSLDLKNR